MDLQNTTFTVQLGRGASIQLANAIINTENFESTIQFGRLQFSTATTKAAAIPVYNMDAKEHARRPHVVEVYAQRAYSVQRT
ncbi:hypothetical protein M5K25_020003 [Dendrobium thyrsiflorum]|uniref:Uncharacterized protein n=1 Tax=Dendrobium thyrsiflorum TaxID=117978 RepID=A0ABD0U8M9_DENTH